MQLQIRGHFTDTAVGLAIRTGRGGTLQVNAFQQLKRAQVKLLSHPVLLRNWKQIQEAGKLFFQFRGQLKFDTGRIQYHPARFKTGSHLR